ncbi:MULTISPECIES: FAD-dependent thymidylate synthase [Streptomyces]|uniref:FAD-dependent thymidylate synthase n=1 Tax=Streptomyces TaxID=1883 RepID=UPI001E61182E|nr:MULTISPECIES: FAD-dependent thymidylate synthase [Streptomyces]UFQ16386.1 FAD-dependent thymidylate synthase [Streptomyces huasconensis]WCL85989.1 FAD-dependent thymidylate synthase [Streptomyces sp. JCM 35825]
MSIEFRSNMAVELIDAMGDDDSVARAARVSSGTTGTPEKNRGLINMLMRDRHGSPFEAVTLQFRIECPVFVAREFFRHRIASYNEVSGRYQVMKPVFYVPAEGRPLQQTGKPGAYRFEPGTPEQHSLTVTAHKSAAAWSWEHYEWLLKEGVAREVARNVLPLSLYTSFYVTLNLRSLLNLLSLRWAHPESTVPTFPLKEIEDIAKQLDEHARFVAPAAMTAFDTHGRVAP